MQEAAETKVFTAHVPMALAAQVDALASRHDRPRGWAIKQALSAWVDQQLEFERLTREALDDVDAGRTVPHSTVESWAASLPRA